MGLAGKLLSLGVDLDYSARVETINITNAQIKLLRAAPKTLVAAKGSNTLIQLVGGVIHLNYGTNVFTESDDNLVVTYTNGSGVAVSQTVEMTAFIDGTADMTTIILPCINPIATAAASFNKPLVLFNSGSGEFGGNAAGDSTLRVKIMYRVHYF